MKKSLKQFISGLIICAVTLAFGFAITAVSFNLFDTLTTGQMKTLFALDVVSLITAGGLAFFLSETKREKKEQQTLK